MKLNELKEKLALEEISLPDSNREITGCYIGDLLSWVMGKASADNAWITIMSNINIVAVASLVDLSCVILAEGVTLDEDVRNAAESKGINVLCTGKAAFEIATIISGAV